MFQGHLRALLRSVAKPRLLGELASKSTASRALGRQSTFRSAFGCVGASTWQRAAPASTTAAASASADATGGDREARAWDWKPKAVPPAIGEEMVKLHRQAPDKWRAAALAKKYGYDEQFVQATLELAELEASVRAQVSEKEWNDVFEPLARVAQEFEAAAAERAGPDCLVLGIPAPWEVFPKKAVRSRASRMIFYRVRRDENVEQAQARAVRAHLGAPDESGIADKALPAPHAKDAVAASEASDAGGRSTSWPSQPSVRYEASAGAATVPKPRVPFIFVERATSPVSPKTGKLQSQLRVVVRDTDGTVREPRPEERNFALAAFGYGASADDDPRTPLHPRHPVAPKTPPPPPQSTVSQESNAA
jgi:hypothetical protein